MALPKNKNTRKLTFEGIEYYWKVEDNTRDFKGLIVTVGIVLTPYKRFVFDFRFDYDKMNNDSNKSAINAVTPKLITEAIVFAVQNYKWGENSTCFFKFESGIFQRMNKE